MLQRQLHNVAWLLLLLLLQTFVFGHIVLYDCAMPMVYVLFAIRLRRGTGRAEALLWCFAMGLLVDIMQLTPGLTAASMTLVGLVQPALLSKMVTKDTLDDCTPSYKTLGVWRYVEYVVMLMVLNNLAYFLLEGVTVAEFSDALMKFATSTLLSTAIVLPMAKLSA